MRLTAKLLLLVLVAFYALLAIDMYWDLVAESTALEDDLRQDAVVLGGALRSTVADEWNRFGRTRAMETIERANAGERVIRLRWVWFDAPTGSPEGPSTSAETLQPALRGETVSVLSQDGETRRLFTYVPTAINPSSRSAEPRETEGIDERAQPQRAWDRGPQPDGSAEFGSSRPGGLELSQSLAAVERQRRGSLVRRAVLFGITALTCFLLAFLLGRRLVGRPLDRIVEKTRRVAAGDLASPLSIPGHDELGELATALNAMCDDLAAAQQTAAEETAARIETLELLRHADRLKSVGVLAAGVAHELGTPLNVTAAHAGLILTGRLPDAEVIKSAQVVKRECARMTTILRQILDFARRRSTARAWTDLRSVVEETVALLEHDAQSRQVSLRINAVACPVATIGDKEQIRQALMNIVVNAIQATPPGESIEVGVQLEQVSPPLEHPGAPSSYVRIFVRDRGPGIAQKDLGRVFEPFFSTKDAGVGTGLGLSVANGIVAEHGGWMTVHNDTPTGSCFSMYFPSEGTP